jgi:RND family efflux transporter MFP subunit
MGKTNHIAKVILILILSGCLTGCSLIQKKVIENEEPAPIPVMVHTAATGDLSSSARFSGRVMSAGEIPVVSLVSGYVKEVRVKLGDTVKKNQVLLVMDDAVISAQIKQLESASRTMILRTAEIEAEIQSLLGVPDPLPENPLEPAQRLASLLTEMQAISSQLTQVQSALAQAKAQKENYIVKAPAAGTVAIVNAVRHGIAAAGNPVMVLVDMSVMYVDITVFENQINQITVGQEVMIHVRSFSEYPLRGEVSTISPIIDAMTRGYKVRIRLGGAEKGGSYSQQGLKIGMFAQAEIPVESYEDVLLIPKEAVLVRMGKQVVYVVQGNIAVEREVTTGFSTNESIEITSGIIAGDLVVVVGQQYLSHQAEVKVQGWRDPL